MKRYLAPAIVAVLILAGIGVWLARRDTVPAAAQSADEQAIARAVAQTQEIMQQGGSGTGVVQDGKFSGAAFGIPGADKVHIDISVNVINSETRASITVTLLDEQPALLTRESFEKVRDGMTYPQVGEALGCVLTRGRMGDGFNGNFGIVQGTRRIDLTFREGKVVKKSAQGID